MDWKSKYIERLVESFLDLGSAHEHFDRNQIDDNKHVQNKSREKLIDMPIEHFLNMAHSGHDEDKMERTTSTLAKGEKFNSIPFLEIQHDNKGNAKTVGHEGRHRAKALLAKGHTSMPVVLKTMDSGSIRWSEQNDGNDYDKVKTWPTKLKGEDSGKSIDFPVKREDAEKSYPY